MNAVRDGLMNLKQTGPIGMDPAVWRLLRRRFKNHPRSQRISISRKQLQKKSEASLRRFRGASLYLTLFHTRLLSLVNWL